MRREKGRPRANASDAREGKIMSICVARRAQHGTHQIIVCSQKRSEMCGQNMPSQLLETRRVGSYSHSTIGNTATLIGGTVDMPPGDKFSIMKRCRSATVVLPWCVTLYA